MPALSRSVAASRPDFLPGTDRVSRVVDLVLHRLPAERGVPRPAAMHPANHHQQSNETDDRVVASFLRDQVAPPDRVLTTIHPQDEMFLFALKNTEGRRHEALMRYFSNGKRIFDAVDQIVNWHFGSWQHVGRFLDFAAGYGRGTRFLRQALPPERLWVSDIYADGVAFLERTLGATGIVSCNHPADYPTEHTFDCIFACSFFSHLPEATFRPWLETLYRLLSDNGLLIFSVHDTTLMQVVSSTNRHDTNDRLHFRPISESRSLDPHQYGESYAGEPWVADQIKAVVQKQDGDAYYRIPRGLCNHQDIYLIAKTPRPQPHRLDFHYHPEGGCNAAYFKKKTLHLHGFARDLSPQIAPSQLVVMLNNEPLPHGVTSWTPSEGKARPHDRSTSDQEWRYRVDCGNLPVAIKPDDIVLVKLVNTFKMDRVVAVRAAGDIPSRRSWLPEFLGG